MKKFLISSLSTINFSRFVFLHRLADDLIERGDPGEESSETSISKAGSTLFASILPQGIGAGPTTHKVPQVIIHDKNFIEPGAALEPKIIALIAPLTVVELLALDLVRGEVDFHYL